MMRSQTQLWLFWLSLAAALASDPVRAQPDEYSTLIAQAVQEFDAGGYAEARALFQRAHDLSPSARTLRGFGLASFEMREYLDAYRALSAALTDERRPLTEEQRESVRGVLEQTRRFIGVFELDVQPSTATVYVDDEPAQLEPDARLLLRPGTHAITARAEGLRESRRTVRVIGGEEERLVFELTGEPPSARGEDLSSPELSSPRVRETRVDTPREVDRTIPLALLITGGAVAATSIVIGLAWWLPRQEEAALCFVPGSCANPDEVFLARDAAAGTTLAIAGLGAVGLIAGTALFFTSNEGSSATSLRCAPGLGAIACHGRF